MNPPLAEPRVSTSGTLRRHAVIFNRVPMGLAFVGRTPGPRLTPLVSLLVDSISSMSSSMEQ